LLRRVALIIIHVSDLRRSVQFYRDRLGLTLVAESSEWAEFRVGEDRLALEADVEASGRPSQAAGRVSISFEVDDVVEAHEILSAAGVVFDRRPAEQEFGMLAVLSDPDGHEIMLLEPR
jgi:catechol 2,3-dioxygenase-like lactoylglutathione lyase family enzyme